MLSDLIHTNSIIVLNVTFNVIFNNNICSSNMVDFRACKVMENGGYPIIMIEYNCGM